MHKQARCFQQSFLPEDTSYLHFEDEEKTQPAIIVNSNTYSREVAAVGNSIAFDNGEVFRITNIECDSSYIIIYLDTYKRKEEKLPF